MKKPDLYFSTDIEADGPYSMLSLGSVAIREDGTEVGRRFIRLKPLEGASVHPKQALWIAGLAPEVREALYLDAVPAENAVATFRNWVYEQAESEKANPVFVAYPAGFDFTFVYWYLMRFGDDSPFSFSALDLKTYAWALQKDSYRNTRKRTMPKHWFDGITTPHNHIAVDDAAEQGQLFLNMRKDQAARKL